MKRRLFALTAAALWFLSAAAAQDAAAQDAGADDFEAALFAEGAFEAEAAAGGTEAAGDASAAGNESARTEYLAGGAFSVKASAAVAGGDSLTARSDLRGKLFAKVSVPDYGSLFVSYAAAYPFFQGYAGGAAAAADDDEAPDYALAELHYSFDLGKRLFVRVGRQLVAWGPSQVWTPADFVNSERGDSFADVDLRTGKNGLRLHLPLGRANLFAFADFSAMNEDGLYGDIADTANAAGRVDFTAGPFEWGFSAYGGRETQARGGFDLSGRVLGTTVYGEAALAPAYGSYERSLQAALGVSRALGELKRWTLSAEAFYNSEGEDRTGLDAASWYALAEDERPTPLYEGGFYAYASLSSTRLGSPYLSGRAYAIANLTDGSFLLRAGPSFAFPRALPFTFELSYYGGGKNKEFTRFAGSGSFGAALSTKIAF